MQNIKNNHHHNSFKLLKNLLPYAKKHKYKILLGLVAMLSAAGANISGIYAIKMIIDFLFSDKSNIKYVVSVVILIYGIKIVAEYYQNYLVKSIGFILTNEVQIEFYKSILFNKHSDTILPEEILSRFANDMQVIRSTFNAILVNFARDILSIIFLIIFMLVNNFKLTCIILLVSLLLFMPMKIISKQVRHFANKTYKNNAHYVQKLKNILDLQANGNISNEEMEKLSNYAEECSYKASELYHQSIRFDSLIPSTMELLNCAIILSLVWFGKIGIASGSISVGSLVAFVAAFNSFYRPLKGLLTRNFIIQDCLSSIARVFEVINKKP